METATTILLAVIASSGLWGLIQFLISRKDGKADKLDGIMRAIQALSDEIHQNQATLARTHILRFNDELINGIHHTEEYFQQTLEDIDTYERYCNAHPDFKNNRCVIAVEHIKGTYKKLLETGFMR